jgi:hypothetical protein
VKVQKIKKIIIKTREFKKKLVCLLGNLRIFVHNLVGKNGGNKGPAVGYGEHFY